MKVSKLMELLSKVPQDYEVVINAGILDKDCALVQAYVLTTFSGTDCHEDAVLADEKNGLCYIAGETQS